MILGWTAEKVGVGIVRPVAKTQGRMRSSEEAELSLLWEGDSRIYYNI